MLKILNKFFDFCGKKNKNKFYKSIIAGIAIAFFEALKIPTIMIMLEAMLNDKVTTQIILECFGLLLLSITGGSFVRYKSTILQCEAGYGTACDKRIEIAEHLRYLPMGYFNDNSLGAITSVTTNTMENLGDVATRVVMLTTQGLLTTFLIEFMILIYDIRIGLIVLVGIVLFLIANSRLQKSSNTVSSKKIKIDTILVERVVEYIQGIAEVKAYNLSRKTSKKLNQAIDDTTKINIDMELKFIPWMTLQNAITKIMGVVMSIVSIYFYLNNSMSLITCIGMIICSFMIYSSLEQAGSYSALLRTVDVSVDRANEILELDSIDINGNDYHPTQFDIKVNDIEFSYDKRKIIDHITFNIPQNTTTAIIGPSGSGKTTLCNLISRFWDVDEGTITLDGKNVKDYSMDSLMNNFSFVFQNVYLFNDTIANNIRFSNPNASINQVIDAAKKACCHDFITKLPDGYETIINEGGSSLSGGEKQRISIARAIMKDSPIIILDEATANVDPENEKDLVDAINELTKNKTIIMIAHRLKTVRNADQIIVIDKGQIVQKGNHQELIKEEGIYKRFVNSRQLATSWKI